MTAVSVENLYKSYGQNEVLKGISFEVKRGEIFAVLGVNGAGKTTLLEIIEGLRRFDEGGIKIMEKPQKEGLALAGVQLQSNTLPEYMKVKEALKLYFLWSGRAETENMSFGLEEVKNKYYKDLSTGWKRRLHLALALAPDPEVIFLDEPTAGLDVEGRAALHKEIRVLKEAGKTVIMASHDMAEVENLCDRLIMLGGGKVVFSGTVNEFTAINKGKFKVHIKLKNDTDYSVFEIDDVNTALLELIKKQVENGKEIADLKIERPTLEDSFLSLAREVK